MSTAGDRDDAIRASRCPVPLVDQVTAPIRSLESRPVIRAVAVSLRDRNVSAYRTGDLPINRRSSPIWPACSISWCEQKNNAPSLVGVTA